MVNCSSTKTTETNTAEFKKSDIVVDDSKVDSLLWNSTIKKLIVIPGIGTEKYVVEKTKIESIIAELGESDGFYQGITDFSTREALFDNNYIYSKLGIKFTTYSDESKGQDIENAIIKSIKFEKNSNAETENGLSIGDGIEKINEVLGQQDEHKDVYSNVTYFYYVKKGITVVVNDRTNKVEEFFIYKSSE